MLKSKWLYAAAMVGAFLVGQHHAHAATFKASKNKTGWLIFVEGEIVLNDDIKFKQVIVQNKIKAGNAGVVLNSLGGNMLAGLDIGFQINNYGFNTWVPDDTYCESICATIWVAGNDRYVADDSHIGFHAVTSYEMNKDGTVKMDKDGHPVQKEDTEGNKYANDMVARYYTYLGFSETTAKYLVSEPPKNMAWLSFDKAKELGIDLKTLNLKEKKTTMK